MTIIASVSPRPRQVPWLHTSDHAAAHPPPTGLATPERKSNVELNDGRGAATLQGWGRARAIRWEGGRGGVDGFAGATGTHGGGPHDLGGGAAARGRSRDAR